MATYNVETDRGNFQIDGPDDATHDELMQAVEDHMHGMPPSSVSGQNTDLGPVNPPESKPPERTDLERARNVLDAVRHGQSNNVGQVGKDTLNLMSAPFRGVRATAIGAGKLLAGEGLQKSASRAAEAVSPEFKPENLSEKVADASSKLMELAAPMLQGGRAVKAGRVITELGTLKGANRAVQALKEGAGIATEKAIEPVAKKFATPLVNALNKMKQTGALKKLPIQDLHEAETQLRNLLDAEKVGGFARIIGKKPAGVLTDQGVALAAKAKQAVVAEQNARVAGLEAARTRVGDVATRNRVRNIILGSLATAGAKKILGKAGGPAMQAVSQVTQ